MDNDRRCMSSARDRVVRNAAQSFLCADNVEGPEDDDAIELAVLGLMHEHPGKRALAMTAV
jgi:hypothetical protein